MGVVADKKGRRALTREEQLVLERFLRLRATQQQRVFELARLYQESYDEEEKAEIWDVLAEIMYWNPQSVMATRINELPSSGPALARHRDYVAQQIKKNRLRLGLTQEELAKEAGIPQSHVCKLETGKHAPTYVTIERLAKALGVKASQLDPGFDD